MRDTDPKSLTPISPKHWQASFVFIMLLFRSKHSLTKHCTNFNKVDPFNTDVEPQWYNDNNVMSFYLMTNNVDCHRVAWLDGQVSPQWLCVGDACQESCVPTALVHFETHTNPLVVVWCQQICYHQAEGLTTMMLHCLMTWSMWWL